MARNPRALTCTAMEEFREKTTGPLTCMARNPRAPPPNALSTLGLG